jgi:hypothetical protein
MSQSPFPPLRTPARPHPARCTSAGQPSEEQAQRAGRRAPRSLGETLGVDLAANRALPRSGHGDERKQRLSDDGEAVPALLGYNEAK